jgi:hypothetical protein
MFSRGQRFPLSKGTLKQGLIPSAERCSNPAQSTRFRGQTPTISHKVCAANCTHLTAYSELRTLSESQLDAYKKGAFLDKADRFNAQDKPSDVPGQQSTGFMLVLGYNSWGHGVQALGRIRLTLTARKWVMATDQRVRRRHQI